MKTLTNQPKGQTKAQALKKIKQMLKQQRKTVLKECERLLNSGGIDTTSHEDNFEVPKIILHVALLNEAHQYGPLSKECKKEADNLKHF